MKLAMNAIHEDGSVIEPNDPDWDALQARAESARTDPAAWLVPEIYGDLGVAEGFAQPFAAWLRLIHAEGARAAMARYLAA